MSRTKTPRDVAELQALQRIATLASQILITLRAPNRGVYESERDLKQWLNEDGVTYTTDVAPALALLEACGRIGRSSAKSNTSRRGWLITTAENGHTAAPELIEAVEVSEAPEPLRAPGASQGDVLTRAVLPCARGRQRSQNRCERLRNCPHAWPRTASRSPRKSWT